MLSAPLAVAALSAAAAVVVQASAAPPFGAAPMPSRSLQLVDDRGHAIGSPVEVCFQVGLHTDCRQIAPGEEVHPPAAFDSLRIEGPGHGPLSLALAGLQARALAGQAAGSPSRWRLAVPRKASLHIERGHFDLPQPSLTVSLYQPQDPSFRQPAFRATLAPGESAVHIPAGELIVSLAAAGHAPDLQRLRARPGEPVALSYRPRSGWSLVARLRAAGDDRPLSGVRVRLAETIGFGQLEKPLAESVSGPDGLILISGLTVSMAGLAAHHPDFLAAEAQGLTASPGTFTFRELALTTGGRLRAQVSVHGRPALGAICELDALVPRSPASKELYQKLWEGNVDAQGICRSSRQAAGVYKLRVSLPQSASRPSRWVTLPEGQDVEVEMPLVPARVTGTVKRSGGQLGGYHVRASRLEADRPQQAWSDPDSEAESDDAGRYELTLWSPGTYILLLKSSSGVAVAGYQQLTTTGDDEQIVDFTLTGSSLQGTVTDEAGQPVEGAVVALQGWEGARSAASDSSGRFQFDLPGKGSASVKAFKSGYRDADPVDVRVLEEEAPIAPVTLVLKRKTTATGTVLSAAGAPVTGALVTSIASTPDGPDAYRSTRSGAAGSFEVEVPPGGPPRVFISGPGCPLSGFDLAVPAAPRDAAGTTSFDTAAAPAILHCPALPAALQLSLADDRGAPLAHAGVILRSGSTIVPHDVLVEHLMQLGLQPETDGGGNLVLAGLAPGDYDLFLNGLSSEGSIAAGLHEGYLTSLTLSALETTELHLTLKQYR